MALLRISFFTSVAAPTAMLLATSTLSACGLIVGDDQPPPVTADNDAGPDASVAPESGPAASADAGPEASADSGPETSADSGPDASADADARPTWSPTDLPGLAIWLDAASGLTTSTQDGTVTWTDRSGHGHDASAIGAVSIVSLAIANHPAAHFDKGEFFSVNDAASLRFGTQDYLVAIVARHTTPTTTGLGYGVLWGKNTSSSNFPGIVVTANAPTNDGSVPTTGSLITQTAWRTWVVTHETQYNDGSPFAVIARRATVGGTTTLSLHVNGALSAQDTGTQYANDVSAAGSPLTIGGTSNATQGLVGDIAEVFAVVGPVADADLNAIDAYFVRQYGL
jgi:hypothetical protein